MTAMPKFLIALLVPLSASAAANAADMAHFHLGGAWSYEAIDAARMRGFAPGVNHMWQESPLHVSCNATIAGKACAQVDFGQFEGIRFFLTRKTPSGPEAVAAEFVRVPVRYTTGCNKGRTRNGPAWYAWCDLSPGDYVLRVEPPSSLGLEVARSEFPFSVHAQRSEADRADVLGFATLAYLGLGQFAEAERPAIEYARALGPVSLPPFILLSDAYEGLGQHRKALEFLKGYLRAPEYRMMINHYLPMKEIVYARLAVAAGEAQSHEEGKALFQEFWRKVKAGEDTGRLPEAYLTAIYGDTASMQGGGRKALVIAASAAGLVLLCIGAFLFVRRTRRSGG